MTAIYIITAQWRGARCPPPLIPVGKEGAPGREKCCTPGVERVRTTSSQRTTSYQIISSRLLVPVVYRLPYLPSSGSAHFVPSCCFIVACRLLRTLSFCFPSLFVLFNSPSSEGLASYVGADSLPSSPCEAQPMTAIYIYIYSLPCELLKPVRVQ